MDEKVEEALDFILRSVDKYGDKIATVCSFGKDSMVVLDLIRQINSELLVLWIKPPFLPEETVKFAHQIVKKWNLNIVNLTSVFEKDKDYMENVVYKPKLWKTNPEGCCQIFKVAPAMKAVEDLNLDAWFSGMRKTESEKRGMYTQIWKQGDFVKLHPIIDFTEADVWRYIACYNIPVHPYYKLGYRSIGCDPCSFPNTWNSERGGRWKDTMMEGGDCGIHCLPMR